MSGSRRIETPSVCAPCAAPVQIVEEIYRVRAVTIEGVEVLCGPEDWDVTVQCVNPACPTNSGST